MVSVVLPRCLVDTVVYHWCVPGMRSANAGVQHGDRVSGSAPLKSRLLNLDSTLQQVEPLAFWQYLTLRVVYYVLHICAPQAGYMPQYSSVAVIFVDQSLFSY